MRFDWYSGTIRDATAEQVLARVSGASVLAMGGLVSRGESWSGGGRVVEVSHPRNGYSRAAIVKEGAEKLAGVLWGGNGETIHVTASGGPAARLASVMRVGFPGHEVTRADVCEDYSGEGVWERLSSGLLGVADAHQLKVTHFGDFHRNKAGRTIYVGSEASPIRVRLYEKGKKEGPPADPLWCRMEAQVRPKGRDQRGAMAKTEPGAVWGAARWLQEVGSKVIGIEELQGFKIGTEYRAGDESRAEWWLLRQYGRLLEEKVGQLGSWAAVGEYLGERLREQQEEARKAEQGPEWQERRRALEEAKRRMLEREARRAAA